VSHRVYIVLDIAEGRSVEAAQSLCDRPGVVKADLLEGSPDLLVICEAFNREKLARLTIEALAEVEQVTENVCLLPVRSNSANTGKRKLSDQRKCGRETLNA
jgi:DNA-binding Lrp family transcriptional regulator